MPAMSPIVASSGAVEGAFALLAVIADPEKAAAGLQQIKDAQEALAARAAELDAREKEVAATATEAAQLMVAAEARGKEIEAGNVGLARREVMLEQGRQRFAGERGKHHNAHFAREAELDAEAKDQAARSIKLAAREDAVALRETGLDVREAELDKRDATLADLAASVNDKRARLAAALQGA